MKKVKAKRPYASARRAEQSAALRLSILNAAENLFAQHGYAATSVKAIAEQAEVALKTVYLAFENKRALLMALFDRRIRGDGEAVPVVEREWFRESLEATEPRRLVQLIARNSRHVKGRATAVLEIIRAAAPGDPQIGELWEYLQKDFHANQRLFIERLRKLGGLRAGLGVDAAVDILWTLNHPNVYRLLVIDRQWTPERYETWLAESLTAQLLAPGKD